MAPFHKATLSVSPSPSRPNNPSASVQYPDTQQPQLDDKNKKLDDHNPNLSGYEALILDLSDNLNVSCIAVC
jgi:hypothetical protein